MIGVEAREKACSGVRGGWELERCPSVTIWAEGTLVMPTAENERRSDLAGLSTLENGEAELDTDLFASGS